MCSKKDDDIVKEASMIVKKVTMFGFLLCLSTLVFLFGGFLLFLSVMGLAVMVWWFPYIFMAAIPFILIIAAIAMVFKK